MCIILSHQLGGNVFQQLQEMNLELSSSVLDFPQTIGMVVSCPEAWDRAEGQKTVRHTLEPTLPFLPDWDNY